MISFALHTVLRQAILICYRVKPFCAFRREYLRSELKGSKTLQTKPVVVPYLQL